MGEEEETQQLVSLLVMRSATRFTEGLEALKREVVEELERDGASRAVAEIIATRGYDLHKASSETLTGILRNKNAEPRRAKK